MLNIFNLLSDRETKNFGNNVAPISGYNIAPFHFKAREERIKICSFAPKSLNEGGEIAETLLKGYMVIVNISRVDRADTQRLIDFLAGVIFSLNGTLEQVSEQVFIFALEATDISGDTKDYKGLCE